MAYYFAPLEGLTDSIYRRLHHHYFPGIDRYYMAFLSPTVHHSLTTRERRDLPAADSVLLTAIPQVLTKSPVDFLWAAGCFRELGYGEVNLNMGCPSGTVVSKGKGAGMLADPVGLERFLDEIFARSPLPVSVKTRIGIQDSREFPAILEILNRYPIQELIIHPRVRKAFYKGPVELDTFAWALEHSKAPVCYNGDLCSPEDIAAIRRRFPQVENVMIGRALIGNPGMLCPGGTQRDTLARFHDHLLEEYCSAFGSRRNAMFRLKENWRHLLCLFENSDQLGKKLRKSTDYDEYLQITKEILLTLPMRERLQPDW